MLGSAEHRVGGRRTESVQFGARRWPLAAFALLLLAAPVVASPGPPDADVLAATETAFAEGTRLKGGAAAARPAFARAAAGYDELWRRGVRNPTVALNRANAHRLAGNLPRAIVAIHEGLANARWDRRLQAALEDARSAVGYPLGDLAAQCRPSPAQTVSTRMSPAEVWLIAGVLWLLACAAVARFAMTRAGWWLAVAAGCVIVLVILSGLWLRDDRHRRLENEHPLVVVAEDAALRRGNSDAYPPRLEARLPKGVEARELARRGGWVQVRLAGGVVGWLPAAAVVTVGGGSGPG